MPITGEQKKELERGRERVGEISRREFLRKATLLGMGAFGASTFLFGCDSGPPESSRGPDDGPDVPVAVEESDIYSPEELQDKSLEELKMALYDSQESVKELNGYIVKLEERGFTPSVQKGTRMDEALNVVRIVTEILNRLHVDYSEGGNTKGAFYSLKKLFNQPDVVSDMMNYTDCTMSEDDVFLSYTLAALIEAWTQYCTCVYDFNSSDESLEGLLSWMTDLFGYYMENWAGENNIFALADKEEDPLHRAVGENAITMFELIQAYYMQEVEDNDYRYVLEELKSNREINVYNEQDWRFYLESIISEELIQRGESIHGKIEAQGPLEKFVAEQYELVRDISEENFEEQREKLINQIVEQSEISEDGTVVFTLYEEVKYPHLSEDGVDKIEGNGGSSELKLTGPELLRLIARNGGNSPYTVAPLFNRLTGRYLIRDVGDSLNANDIMVVKSGEKVPVYNANKEVVAFLHPGDAVPLINEQVEDKMLKLGVDTTKSVFIPIEGTARVTGQNFFEEYYNKYPLVFYFMALGMLPSGSIKGLPNPFQAESAMGYGAKFLERMIKNCKAISSPLRGNSVVSGWNGAPPWVVGIDFTAAVAMKAAKTPLDWILKLGEMLNK